MCDNVLYHTLGEPGRGPVVDGRSDALRARVGINRETVRWYLRLRKPAISIAGVGAGRRSRCERFERLAEVICAKLEVGLSA
jgi:hypothetical protein